MSLIVLSILYIGVLALIMGVCFFGDPESTGPLGRLTYFFTVWLPVNIEAVLNKIPGGSYVVSCCGGTYDYVCNKPNPLLQILYLLLVIGGFIVFLVEAMPSIPNRYLGEIHHVTSHLAVIFTLGTFVVASMSNPGRITKETHKFYDHYEYDGFLYVKRVCPTCGLRKIPRSKHCAIHNQCYAKFDHQCPWICNVVGERNYRYFLLFLFSTMCLLFYGFFGVAAVLLDYVEERRLLTRYYINRETGEKVPASFAIVATFLVMDKGFLCMLGVLAGVMGVVVAIFLLYHISLIVRGITTNESGKLSGVSRYYKTLTKEREKGIQDGILKRLSPEEQAKFDKEMVDPEKAPSIERREPEQFPWGKPVHIYNLGIIGNFKEVLFPPSIEVERRLLAEGKRSHSGTKSSNSGSAKNNNTTKKKKKKKNA